MMYMFDSGLGPLGVHPPPSLGAGVPRGQKHERVGSPDGASEMQAAAHSGWNTIGYTTVTIPPSGLGKPMS